MLNIKELFQRRKAKRLGVRLSDLHHFRAKTILQLESPCRLSKVITGSPTADISTLTIGAYSYIRSNSELLSISEIGRFCSIGRGVTLGLNPRNHPIDWISTSEHVSRGFTPTCKPLRIGHDVWIGHDAVIMAGLSIGHGAVIGCNTVVTKDVLPYQIVAGNPAKTIRFRFSEKNIKQLLASQWWDYDIKQLRNVNFQDLENFHINQQQLTKKSAYSSIRIKNKKVSTV